MIYWDHNASSPIIPRALEAVEAAYRQALGHPSSLHQAGRQAAAAWEQLVDSLSQQLDCRLDRPTADKLIWTTTGSAANQLALQTLSETRPGRILVGATEHPSVLDCVNQLRRNSTPVETIPVNQDGVLDVRSLTSLLRKPASLVVVQWANHETGVIQPIDTIATLCRQHDVVLHVDAVQAVAKIDCLFRANHVDSLAFAGHKFGAPRGLAGWLCHERLAQDPRIAALAEGTPPIEMAAGLLAAWQYAGSPEERRRVQELRDLLESRIQDAFPHAVIHGSHTRRTHQTTSVAFPGVDRQALLMALDLAGLCCSVGAACASGSAEPAPTLLAMGIDPALVGSSIRLSLGHTTTAEEIEIGFEILRDVVQKLLAKSGSPSPP